MIITIPLVVYGIIRYNYLSTKKNFTDSPVDEIINDTIKSSNVNSIKEMGKVINIIKEEYDGMMDFGYVSKIVKERLLNLDWLIYLLNK